MNLSLYIYIGLINQISELQYTRLRAYNFNSDANNIS